MQVRKFKDAVKRSVPVLMVAIAASVGMVEVASAASVLDTGMTTAVTSGLTDVKDTVKDVLGLGLAFVISTAVLLSVPGIVMSLVHKAAGK